jgi:D-alanine--poly(phosphoribitol) ligase subunit 2
MSSDKIRDFMEQRFLIEFDKSFPEDTDLFKEGVMDSFGYVQLCRFLEQEFGFAFSEEDLTANVLVSLARIRAFVEQKSPSGSSGRTVAG